MSPIWDTTEDRVLMTSYATVLSRKTSANETPAPARDGDARELSGSGVLLRRRLPMLKLVRVLRFGRKVEGGDVGLGELLLLELVRPAAVVTLGPG